MKIRYYLDGIADLSDDVEVVAQTNHYFYILKNPDVLYGISRDLVPVKVYENADDEPPHPVKWIRDSAEYGAIELEYHLPSLNAVN